MNKLDLNAYGVSEMSNAEMRETDGGILFILPAIPVIKFLLKCAGWIGGYLAADMIMNPQGTADAWNAGRERANNP